MSANLYVTNIVPLFNVSSNAGGTTTAINYANQITGFQTMLDYTTFTVTADIIQGASATEININSDLLLTGQLYINSYPVGPDINGSNFTSGTAFTVQTSNELTALNLTNPTVQFIVNGNEAFTINNIANSIFSGTITCQGINQPSDRRLKTNITTVSNSLSTILELNAVQYTMNAKDALGFIAQDVNIVLPMIVNTTTPYWSIDYTQLIPLLVESIKELSAEVKRLERGLV